MEKKITCIGYNIDAKGLSKGAGWEYRVLPCTPFRLSRIVIFLQDFATRKTYDYLQLCYFQTQANILVATRAKGLLDNPFACYKVVPDIIFSPCSVKNDTVCPRSSDPFYIVTYYMKWVTISWTHSIFNYEK